MKTCVIIGFGRFGRLLAELSKGYFSIYIIEPDEAKALTAKSLGYLVIPIEQACEFDFVFLAIPISSMETMLRAIGPSFTSNQVIVDLCSVKVYPVLLMQKYIKNAQIIGSHPMFGPDSAKKGLENAQVALCPIRISDENIVILQGLWERHSIVTIETTPEAHDQDVVYSQAFTYSIARLILNTNIPDITFKTRSFKDIQDVARLSAKDTEQLFHDMLFYNPYFKDMKAALENSISKTMPVLESVLQEQHTSR